MSSGLMGCSEHLQRGRLVVKRLAQLLIAAGGRLSVHLILSKGRISNLIPNLQVWHYGLWLRSGMPRWSLYDPRFDFSICDPTIYHASYPKQKHFIKKNRGLPPARSQVRSWGFVPTPPEPIETVVQRLGRPLCSGKPMGPIKRFPMVLEPGGRP